MQCRFISFAPVMLLMTQGCEQQPQRFSDQAIQEMREGMPGITERCLNEIKSGGIEAMPSGTDKCFEMTPARQWKGLWRREFENSRFCPSPAVSCSYQTAGDRIWLSGKPLTSLGNGDGLYEVEFVGRQTAHKGRYGHMSTFDHEIIVDKVVNFQPVGAASAG
ncbi:MAG: hypothetical protein CMN63_04105 [Sphingobium sp.]|nr:hypothetical protein [Sphingobium sp.]|tara:strand:- start:915 stop:1403 length:489 start_codon:yes stop_codon:yes gene_type:complete